MSSVRYQKIRRVFGFFSGNCPAGVSHKYVDEKGKGWDNGFT
jgi:hypothetical protein